MDKKDLQSIATQIRRDIVRMVHLAKSGHPGGSLGCADFFTALFFQIMDFDPQKFEMSGKNEDMFFLSNGHITPVLYSTLARRGYFPVSDLAGFRQFASRLQGHPSVSHHLPGIRVSTGSLGQGLSMAVGAAVGKKMDNDNHLVYVLSGDGELQEGQNWEALMFAAAKNVDNIIYTVDYNGLQIDGPTENVCNLGDLHAKMEAFGWYVLTMNGHDYDDIFTTLEKAKSLCGYRKPVVILMKSEMGHGVDFMTNDYKWHGSVPTDEQLASALMQLPETLGDF
ncbi:MAG: transketolase [Bacteroidales bacterium]|nr:transketolase [Bacteroidales bacterium]